MNKDGPNGSPYGTLVKHDQSETKHDMCVESKKKRKDLPGRWQRRGCLARIERGRTVKAEVGDHNLG
jgi:hypothetical protein